MIKQALIHPQLFAIKHKPTGKLLRANPSGRCHTRIDLEPKKGFTDECAPRIFTSEKSAKMALIRWAEGIHRNMYEDGLQIYQPQVPRFRDDFEVIEVMLYTQYDPEKV